MTSESSNIGRRLIISVTRAGALVAVVGFLLNSFFYDLDALQNSSMPGAKQAEAACPSDALNHVAGQGQQTQGSADSFIASTSVPDHCLKPAVTEAARASF